MENRLNTTMQDGTWAEEVLAATQERVDKVVVDLLALQELRRIFEKSGLGGFSSQETAPCSTTMAPHYYKFQIVSECCVWRLPELVW